MHHTRRTVISPMWSENRTQEGTGPAPPAEHKFLTSSYRKEMKLQGYHRTPEKKRGGRERRGQEQVIRNTKIQEALMFLKLLRKKWDHC